MLKIGWKSWTLIFLGSLTALLSYTLISQWKHASLGRQVTRNVVKFLTEHGSSTQGDVISGGMVSAPLKTHAAVNATILQLLESLDYQLKKARPAESDASQPLPPPSSEDDDTPIYSTRSSSRTAAPQKRGASAPIPSSSPSSPSSSSTPRQPSSPIRRASAVPQPKIPPTDDDGFTGDRNPEDYQFNPNEFGGKGQQTRLSLEDMMKDDDGFQ